MALSALAVSACNLLKRSRALGSPASTASLTGLSNVRSPFCNAAAASSKSLRLFGSLERIPRALHRAPWRRIFFSSSSSAARAALRSPALMAAAASRSRSLISFDREASSASPLGWAAATTPAFAILASCTASANARWASRELGWASASLVAGSNRFNAWSISRAASSRAFRWAGSLVTAANARASAACRSSICLASCKASAASCRFPFLTAAAKRSKAASANTLVSSISSPSDFSLPAATRCPPADTSSVPARDNSPCFLSSLGALNAPSVLNVFVSNTNMRREE